MLLFASLALVAVACNDNSGGENELPNGIEPIISTDKAGEVGEADKELIAFFEKYLPPNFSLYDSEYFFVEDEDNRCLMINSMDELKAIMYSPIELPDIDFDKYTLVMGQYIAPGTAYRIIEQSITVNPEEIILNLSIEEPDGTYAVLSPLYYWGLYPKIPQKTITVNLIVK
jgi:hypothetical protein